MMFGFWLLSAKMPQAQNKKVFLLLFLQKKKCFTSA